LSLLFEFVFRLRPMPDLSKPPLHTLPHDELIAKLKSLTNLRAVPDPAAENGWKIELDKFPGGKKSPLGSACFQLATSCDSRWCYRTQAGSLCYRGPAVARASSAVTTRRAGVSACDCQLKFPRNLPILSKLHHICATDIGGGAESGTPGAIRTRDLWLRRTPPTLYEVVRSGH